MDLGVLLHDYGWGVVFVYIVLKEMLPTMRDRLIPHYAEERRRKQDQEHTTTHRLAEWEERQLVAFEKLSDAFTKMSEAMTVNNERTEAHDRTTRDQLTRIEQNTQPLPRKARAQ